jgi:hypothetical protein
VGPPMSDLDKLSNQELDRLALTMLIRGRCRLG